MEGNLLLSRKKKQENKLGSWKGDTKVKRPQEVIKKRREVSAQVNKKQSTPLGERTKRNKRVKHNCRNVGVEKRTKRRGGGGAQAWQGKKSGTKLKSKEEKHLQKANVTRKKKKKKNRKVPAKGKQGGRHCP